MKPIDKLMYTLIVAFGLANVLLRSAALAAMWSWHVVPLGAPLVPFRSFVAVSFLLAAAIAQPSHRTQELSMSQSLSLAVTPTIMWSIVIVVAWCCS